MIFFFLDLYKILIFHMNLLHRAFNCIFHIFLATNIGKSDIIMIYTYEFNI